MNVTCVSEEHHQDFIIRNLSYSMKDNESMPANQEVVQYSYTGWPSDSIVPKSANSLMNLIEMVLQRQSSLMGSQAPIVVHCR